MFKLFNKLFKKKVLRRKFERSVLRKNDILLLILDERWNGLFQNTPKTEEITDCEKRLKELLKEQARLNGELKNLSHRKKVSMDRIIKLTPDVFEKNDEQAKLEMHKCEKEIKDINERLKKIEEELEINPDKVRETNLELLEYTVNNIYFKMRENQKRIKELETLIEVTRQKLKEYTEEKELLSQDDTDTYSYFHDLLGGEELEKLDREYFGEVINKTAQEKSSQDDTASV